MVNQPVDYQAITGRQKENWDAASHQAIALRVMDMAEDLIRAVDPRPTQRVLDLASGTGNGALLAARRDCDAVGIDYAPSLLERAQAGTAAGGD